MKPIDKIEQLPDSVSDDCFYALHEGEVLHESPEDAVREQVESGVGLTMLELFSECRWPIILEEYTRDDKPSADAMLERMVEEWDEDFGTDDYSTKVTDAMRAKMGSLLEEFTVFRCSPTGRLFSVNREQAEKMLEGEQ